MFYCIDDVSVEETVILEFRSVSVFFQYFFKRNCNCAKQIYRIEFSLFKKEKKKKKKKRVTSCIFCCMSSESFRIWNVPSFTFELLSAFLRVVGDRGTIFFFLF